MPDNQADKTEVLRTYFAREPWPGVASAYLFGSHAQKRSHRDSDVDIAVLLDWELYPTRAKRFDVRVRMGSDLISALHENTVDLVILNDAPPLLGREIVLDGIRVWQGDAEADEAYVMKAQLRAADLAPWLRRMRRIKLEALAR